MRYLYNLTPADFTTGMLVEVELPSIAGSVWIPGTVEEVTGDRILILRKDGRYRSTVDPKAIRAIVQ